MKSKEIIEIVNNFEDSQLLKRIKSLLWRALGMGLAVIVAFVSDNLFSLELSPVVTTLVGLVIGEITKWINVTWQLKVGGHK